MRRVPAATAWARVAAAVAVLLCLDATVLAVLDGTIAATAAGPTGAGPTAAGPTLVGLTVSAVVTVVVALSAATLVTFPLVGLVITRAQPRHTVGWTFLLSGLFLAVEKAGSLTAQFGARHGWPDGVVHLAAWAQSWSWFPGLGVVITIGLLHFPTGRPVSPRWRWLDVLALAVMAVFAGGYGVAAWGVSAADLISATTPTGGGWRSVVIKAGFAVFLGIIPPVVGAVASLVVRWRRSAGIERQQIRWVAGAGFAAVLAEVADYAAGSRLSDTGQTLLESCSFALVAVAIAVAIMRYRLYEIDRIISRTVGWTLVTACLVAVYVGLAAAAGAVIPARYGSVGVAAATLAAAALFVPVRRRVHRAVDRRFDRAGYDAARIVDTFAGRVRARVGTATLDDELLQTVQAAVAPATASVWFVPTGDR